MKNMSKKLLCIALATGCLLLFVSCSSDKETTNSDWGEKSNTTKSGKYDY